MGDIIQFEVGCRRCEHLIQTGKNTWMCANEVHLDDSAIYPIVDGKKNEEDWNICEGESYKAIVNKRRKTRSS